MLFLLPITSHSQLPTRLCTVQCTVKFTLSNHPSKTVSGTKGRLSQSGTNFELYLSSYSCSYWFNFVKLHSSLKLGFGWVEPGD